MNIDKIFALGYTQEYFDKIKEHPYVGYHNIDFLCNKIFKVYNYFINIGYSSEETLYITTRNLSVLVGDISLLDRKFNYLESLYNSFCIAKNVVRIYPNILSMDSNTIESKINGMCKIGYSRNEIIDISRGNPGIFAHSVASLEKKINDFMELGFSFEQTRTIMKKNPSLFIYKETSIKDKIDDILALGYSYDDVRSIIIKFPKILSYSLVRIKNRIVELESLGYTHEQVLKMTKLLPSLFGLHIDTIREKKEFYDSIGIGDIITLKPMYLMQSIEVSYARYMFYKSIGKEINKDNYLLLFMLQTRFIKKYGKTKEELINEFNYDKYLEEKKNIKVKSMNKK